MTFGGDGVFDESKSIVVDGEIYADSRNILKYFDNIIPGKKSNLFIVVTAR